MALPEFGPGQMHGKPLQIWRGEGLLIAVGERGPQTEIGPHTHRLPSLATLLVGEHRFFDPAGSMRSSRHGAWYFRPAGETQHHLKSRKPIRTLLIEFDPQRFGIGAMPTECQVLDTPQALGLAEKIVGELGLPGIRQEIILTGLALQTIGLLMRDGRPVVDHEAPDWLIAAREIAHERFAKGVGLPEVAREVGVHPAHLSRAFRTVFGVPFSDYLIQLRLTYARDALRNSNAKIAQIAADSGFSDHAHLTRAFRRRYEVSPSEFRAQIVEMERF